MPRPPRIDIPGLIYHVTSRGARQLAIYHDDQDRQMFLRFLLQAKEVFPFKMHAYSLMTNHFHLLIQTITSSISQIMQRCTHAYSSWLNMKYDRVGHSFQGRFHSIPVETDAYFTTVCSYIHLNAVRAGIVERPEEYPWSDYGHLIRGEKNPNVDSQFLLGYFNQTGGDPIGRYQRFVEERKSRSEPITLPVLYRMRSWGALPIIGTKTSK